MGLISLLVLLFLLDVAFGFGTVLRVVTSRAQERLRRADLEMKRKGKRVSIQDRGEYMKRKRILDARSEYESAQEGNYIRSRSYFLAFISSDSVAILSPVTLTLTPTRPLVTPP